MRWVTSMTNGRVALAMTLAILVAGAALPSRAGGFGNPDFGTRRCGMMAVMGKPDDLTAIYANPAGLTLQKGTNVYLAADGSFSDFGFKFFDSAGKLRGAIQGNAELKADPSWTLLPFVAIESDFGTKRLRGGLAVYSPNLGGTSLPGNEASRYHLVNSLNSSINVTGALAYQISDKFSLGAGISAVYVRQSSSRFSNPLIDSNPDKRWDASPTVRAGDSRLDSSRQGWAWDWNVGLLFRPLKTLGLGFSFMSAADVTLKGTLKTTDSAGKATNHHQTSTLVTPLSLRAGINWEFVPNVEFGADVYYWHYQTLQEERVTVDGSPTSVPKSYANAWNVSLGLLYRPIAPLDLMIGYQHDNSPIPGSTLSLDDVTRNRNTVSLGARWRALSWMQVGLTYQRTWFDLLNIQDSVLNPPTNIKGHNSLHQVALDLAFKVL